jgi:hypothetical protein
MLDPGLAEKARDDVFFASWVSPDSSMEELMAVKPLELASSQRLNWKYLIYDGLAHKVTSDGEVDEIYSRINDHRKKNHRP